MPNLCIVGAMGRMGQNVAMLADTFGFIVTGARRDVNAGGRKKTCGRAGKTDIIIYWVIK